MSNSIFYAYRTTDVISQVRLLAFRYWPQNSINIAVSAIVLLQWSSCWATRCIARIWHIGEAWSHRQWTDWEFWRAVALEKWILDDLKWNFFLSSVWFTQKGNATNLHCLRNSTVISYHTLFSEECQTEKASSVLANMFLPFFVIITFFMTFQYGSARKVV